MVQYANMDILLESFYKQDLHSGHFIDRKVQLDDISYQITGITQSGKSTLVKHYLLGKKKSSYLYIDCDDIRIDKVALNEHLAAFCKENKIVSLALDNYESDIKLPDVTQVIIITARPFQDSPHKMIRLYPLAYEEFLAYEHKFDSTALNHFFQLGGLPAMHAISSEERIRYIQSSLQHALSDIEFDLMLLVAKMAAQKVSSFTLYERLKTQRKISKDMLYQSVHSLVEKGYLHQLEKFKHPRATKKLYLCDIAVKNALTTQKHFGRLFENLIYLELLNHGADIYYEEKVDFYLPSQRRIVLSMPFGNEEKLFKSIEAIEGLIITQNVSKVEVVTMSSEGLLNHPFVKAEMIPFALWALSEHD